MVRDIRAALPRIWRAFTGDDSSSAAISESQLMAWLRNSGNSRLEGVTNHSLWQALRAISRGPLVRVRLGFRFKDPSKNGSWNVQNLIGFSCIKKRKRTEDVSWDYLSVGFRLRLLPRGREDAGRVEIRRSVDRQALNVRVEKRRYGDTLLPTKCERYIVTARSRCASAEQDRRKRVKIERRKLDLLPTVNILPLEPVGPRHQWTFIYLHGMNESALQNYAGRPHYFFDGSIAVKVVIPTAPSRELSCFDRWWVRIRQRCSAKATPEAKSRPRWKLQQFRAWYDYISNYDGVREDTLDYQSLKVVQTALHSLIRQEAKTLGNRSDRIILGGKSQGCCTALDAALTYPEQIGGFIGLVGHLLGCTPVNSDGAQINTPLHFFHEPEDHLMRWKWVQLGEKRLRDAGYCVRSRHQRDPENHGHFIEGVEGAWIRTALRQICVGNK